MFGPPAPKNVRLAEYPEFLLPHLCSSKRIDSAYCGRTNVLVRSQASDGLGVVVAAFGFYGADRVSLNPHLQATKNSLEG